MAQIVKRLDQVRRSRLLPKRNTGNRRRRAWSEHDADPRPGTARAARSDVILRELMTPGRGDPDTLVATRKDETLADVPVV